MRFRFVIAALFTFFLSSLAPSPSGASPITFQSFNDPYGYPQQSIGLVIGRRERAPGEPVLGTGVLVRPHVAVTAGHVVYDFQKGWLTRSFYVPQNAAGQGYDPANISRKRKISILRRMKGYRQNIPFNNLASFNRDFGTMIFRKRLQLPIARMYPAQHPNWLLPIENDPLKADALVHNNLTHGFARSIYGYLPDRYWWWNNNRLSMHTSGTFGGAFQLVGAYFDNGGWRNTWYQKESNDGAGGLSGAPVFAHFTSGVKKVIGIVISSSHTATKTLGIRGFDTNALKTVIHAQITYEEKLKNRR